MKLFENLNEENFLLFAANNYRNKQCTDVEEFYGDLNRFKYIKRLLSRYTADCEELQERLLLNHLVSQQSFHYQGNHLMQLLQHLQLLDKYMH